MTNTVQKLPIITLCGYFLKAGASTLWLFSVANFLLMIFLPILAFLQIVLFVYMFPGFILIALPLTKLLLDNGKDGPYKFIFIFYGGAN